MQYRFVTEKQNYEDYAAGRVIMSQSGNTSFPVRLVSEIFQRCANFFPDDTRLTVYDPCCGSAYLLTVLGFLHSDKIVALHGSDINSDFVSFAADNLNLLTPEGLAARRDNLQHLADTYGKSSHQEALNSLDNLLKKIPKQSIESSVWQANALEQSAEPDSVDLIICDVPYGGVTEWQAIYSDNPLTDLLEAQHRTLVDKGIIAIISDKKQRITAHPQFTQVQHEKIGKRHFVIFQKN